MELHVSAERRATARLTTATWVPMVATAVLAAATIALVIATATRITNAPLPAPEESRGGPINNSDAD